MKKWIGLLLAACILAVTLTGCFSMDDLSQLFRPDRNTAFSEMEYQRPDMDALRAAFQAVEDGAGSAKNVRELMELVYAAYGAYYDFSTAYALAQIHYNADLTQESWAEEDAFCSAASPEVDALLDQMFFTLASCPLKDKLEDEKYFGPGFFDDYQGESLWDDTFTELMEQDSQLQVKYYELSTQALECSTYEEYYSVYGVQMAQVYAEMVKLRQQIAAYCGYDSYADFAYDFTFGRDYSPDNARAMLQKIRENLVPLYRSVAFSDIWELAYRYCSEETTFSYVENTANALGGVVGEAFALMRDYGLYDLTYSDNKFDASFTVYLINYDEPYIFLNPTRGAGDQLTFTHEFGHFCNAYAAYGEMPSVDVAEFFSQGLEYLSIPGSGDADLERYKLADCLSVYVEQAAFAAFEDAVYAMEEPTGQGIRDLFSQTMADYGMDIWDIDPLGFVQVSHFFTDPMYIVSYVVSNDAAFQLYQMEKEETGTASKLYVDHLATTEPGFLAFLEQVGLESPFAEGRIPAVKATLEQMLNRK